MSNRLHIGLKFIHLCCQCFDASGTAVLLSCFSRLEGESERLDKPEERKNPSFHPRVHCNGETAQFAEDRLQSSISNSRVHFSYHSSVLNGYLRYPVGGGGGGSDSLIRAM